MRAIRFRGAWIRTSRKPASPKTSLERLLWLKAICFNSGVTKTAEEAILRAYDLMLGGQRPEFVPSRS